jgi:hypothetical protein
MNPRQLAILAVVALASVGTAAAVLRTGTPTVASDRRGERILPGLLDKANDITAVTVRKGEETLSMERRGAAFVAAGSGYPVKTDAVRDLLASSMELTYEEARTSDSVRYAELGLADSGSTGVGTEVTFRTAGSEIADFIVGNRDATVGGPVGGVFVRPKSGAQTFLARGNVRLPSSRSDWFAPVDLAVKRSEIRKVEITGGGRDAITATATAEKPGQFTLENVPEKRTADSYRVGRLSAPVEGFSFQDVRKHVQPADDARRMVVDSEGGLRLVLTSIGDPAEGWVAISADATDEAARERAKAITAKVDGYDFRIPSGQADVLVWTMGDLTNEEKS